jgi:predicted PurR-regulated permease PerM
MDAETVQLNMIENAIESAVAQVMYVSSLGKSSLWLCGNISICLLFVALILFFAVLNYKQRKIVGIEEKGLIKFFQSVTEKVVSCGSFNRVFSCIKKYSFYIEFVICAAIFAFFTHISVFWAVFLAIIYVLLRLFLLKKISKLFRRKVGVTVPLGAYFLFCLFFAILLFFFNVMPALVEVSAQEQQKQEMSQLQKQTGE